MIKVIKDFLPKDIQDNLKDLMISPSKFSWYFNHKTTYYGPNVKRTGDNLIEQPQLTHIFLNEEGDIRSTYYNKVCDVARYANINVKHWYRIKANLLFNKTGFTKDSFNTVHRDRQPKDGAYSFIYYVNDSDGETKFWKEPTTYLNVNTKPDFKYKPKKGTGVLFDSHTWHCSSAPIKNDYRMVINYIFQPKDT